MIQTPTRCNINGWLIIPISSTCFGRWSRPSSGALDCVTACGIMHPLQCRPATPSVHYTTSCNTQSSVPEDGRDQRPKHVELIGIINKPLLLHIFGDYIIYFQCVVPILWLYLKPYNFQIIIIYIKASCIKFSSVYKLPQHFRCQMGDVKQVSYWVDGNHPDVLLHYWKTKVSEKHIYFYICSLCSFVNFPDVWSIKAEVSELNVGSIVLGYQE